MLHDEGLHYKMYKAKKRWLFAGMGIIMTSSALLMGGSVVAHADETSTTAVADAPAETPTDGDATGQTSTSTETNPVEQARQAYINYRDGHYKTASDAYQEKSSQVSASQQTYDQAQQAYEDAAQKYQQDVNAKAPGNQTTNQQTANDLKGEYNSVNDQYTALTHEQDNINSKINQSNDDLDAAYQQLQEEYNNLPESVKKAGEAITDYNQNKVPNDVTELVSQSTNNAYKTAMQGQTGGNSALSTVLAQLSTVTANTDKAKAVPDADSVAINDGKLGATLYGKTYTDKNDDGKITYEDDILPAITQDLQSDLTKAQNNQTDFTGSYSEIVTLFNYMKQVADTALPTGTVDGVTGRVESKNANNGSDLLEHQMSPLLNSFSTEYANEFLKAIEGTESTVMQKVQDIDTSTGNTFDGDGLKASFNKELLAEAINIYNSQTDEMLDNANQLLQAFQKVQDKNDPLWQNSSGYLKPSEMITNLTNAIETTKTNVAAGKAALATLQANADKPDGTSVENALSLVYSKGDADAGFTQDQTIQSLWSNLYNTIDWFGTGMSPLLKTDVQKADPNATKGTDGNTFYSTDFIKAHQELFDAASALTNSVTDLVQQSSTITDNFSGVLQKLLTVPADFNVTLPQKATGMPTTLETPTKITLPVVTLVEANVTANLNYIDSDNGNNLVKNEVQTARGYDGETYNWTAKIPVGYKLAVGQSATGTFKTNTTVTIRLSHNVETSKVEQNYITNYALMTNNGTAVSLPGGNTQTVTWTVQTDQVTGDWTATPDLSSTTALATPTIIHDSTGTISFIPDLSAFNGKSIALQKVNGNGQAGLTAKIGNRVQTVTYYEAKVAPGIAVGFKEQVPDTAPSTTPTNPPTTGGGETGDPTVVENGGGDPTVVVPDGGNGSQPAPADDDSTTTDAGGDASTTGPDSQTTETGRSASEGQATGNSQSVSGGTAVQNNDGGVTAVQTGTQTDSQQGSSAQGQLPQTNETDENAAAGLGVLGLSLLMGALGLKKRKRD